MAALLAATLLAIGSPLSTPSPAYAAFTAVADAGPLTASAMVLAAPANNTVVATCTPVGASGKHRLAITVAAHGTVPRANAYSLSVYDPTGANRSTIDLAQGSSYSSNTATAGTWTYAVDALYKVPGSSNVWTSAAAQVSVVC